MYFAVLNRDGWDWIFVFLYTACAVIRLARFNVEQAGRAKKYFHGLPSPAAGLTLATYYWFSQTDLYSETMIGDLPWHVVLRYLMLMLAFLMISNVSYPAVPTVGYRKPSEILGSLVVAATFFGVLFLPKEFFFPALILYVLYGLVKTVVYGLMDRRPSGDAPVISDEDEGLYEPRTQELMEPELVATQRKRRRRRRPGERRKADAEDQDQMDSHPHQHREPQPIRVAVVEGSPEPADRPAQDSRRSMAPSSRPPMSVSFSRSISRAQVGLVTLISVR